MSIDTHVCLVSAQAAPNLLPMLDDELKPNRVILLVTPQMKEKANHLKEVIQPRGIKVEQIEIDNAANFDSIQEILLNELSKVDQNSIALNVTGGTKWMAIAAQEIFRMNNSPVFYVDVESDRVFFLDRNKDPHPLIHRIDFSNYLKTYGYRIISEDKSGLMQNHKKFCEELVYHVKEWEGAVGFLNKLASDAASRDLLKSDIHDPSTMPIYFDKLLNECRQANLVKQGNLQSIEFCNVSARTFCNGGWLEAYASNILSKLRSDGILQDPPHVNAVVENSKGIKNEIDVAFMAKNRLHIIECKTKRMKENQSGQSSADTVYKLDSISELGGLGTKPMLISYKRLGKTDKKRAQDLRIKVIESEQIQNLKTHLEEWINK